MRRNTPISSRNAPQMSAGEAKPVGRIVSIRAPIFCAA
jgi:hypothetical protein